jgi:hypothetical protein
MGSLDGILAAHWDDEPAAKYVSLSSQREERVGERRFVPFFDFNIPSLRLSPHSSLAGREGWNHPFFRVRFMGSLH